MVARSACRSMGRSPPADRRTPLGRRAESDHNRDSAAERAASHGGASTSRCASSWRWPALPAPVAGVGRCGRSSHYRVRSAPPALLRARAGDGWELAVHHRPGEAAALREPVLLCHGLAANRYTFDFDPPYSLAHALCARGLRVLHGRVARDRGSRAGPPRGRSAGGTTRFDDHIELRRAGGAATWRSTGSGADGAFWVGALARRAHRVRVRAEAGRRAQLAGLRRARARRSSFEPDPFLRGARPRSARWRRGRSGCRSG